MPFAYSYIRWSSEKQKDGDSERRQRDAIDAYVKKHKLTLADLTFKDAGVSAFRGKNAIEGELAAFIKAVDSGLIPKGSYLLVENFDRLSRAPVNVALRLFQDIVGREITIVTLTDERVYSTKTINENWTQLVVALAVMARAHEENQRKSTNVKKAWDAKRSSGGVMTAMGPGWLRLSTDRKSWIQDKKKVAVIHRIFKMAIEGNGSPTIAATLNSEGVPTFRSAAFWTSGVVAAVLANEAVIGTLVAKRAKADPIENYYPAVLDRETFLKAQAQIRSRLGKGGIKGEAVSNLFAGMVFCGVCGERMRFVSGRNPHRYLRCLRAYSGAGCDAGRVPYEPVEDQLLKRLLVVQGRSIDVLAAMNVPDPTLELKAELEATKRKLSNIIRMAEETGSPTLAERIIELESTRSVLEQQLRDAIAPTPARPALREAEYLYAEHKTKKQERSPDLGDIRLKLQAAIRRIIQRIELFPEDESMTVTFVSGAVRQINYILMPRGFQPGNRFGSR